MNRSRINARTKPGPLVGVNFWRTAWLLVGLLCAPLPALAESIVWNGAGQPGTTGTLRPDPMGLGPSLFPDSPSGNSVTVNADLPSYVFGGLHFIDSGSAAAESSNNRVSVSGGSIGDDVYGGYAEIYSGDATATGNSVSVSGGNLGDDVHGGYAYNNYGTGTATGNSVSVSGGSIGDNVYGGYTFSLNGDATATGNSVSVSGGNLGDDVHGGYARNNYGTGTATGNSVSVSGGSIGGNVYGGYAASYDGTTTTTTTATGNSVNVSGGSIGGNVYGGYAHNNSGPGTGTGTATGNSVSVSGGSIGGNVYGGYTYNNSITTTATGNSVSVSGGSIGGNVYGGYAYNYYGPGTTTATGNSVSVSGGSIGGNVYGGYAYKDSGTGTTTATGNSVSVSGGSIGGNVYGGYAHNNSGPGTGTGTATGNSVTLSGALIFDSASDILGGDDAGQGGDIFTGNTLNIWNYSGSQVHDVANFEHYNFVLPASQQGLSANSVNFADPNNNNRKSTVTGIAMVGGGSAPKTGDVLTLISSTNLLTGTVTNAGTTISGQKGVTLLYDFLLQQESNSLTATVRGVQVNPRAKAVTEEQSARSAVVNQAGDLAAGLGMDAAKNATGGSTGLASFFAGQGAKARYNTGSHVDVLGFSIMTGLASSLNAGDYKLLRAAFFEAGIGNYNSHNSFAGYAPVDAKGNTMYYGGGALALFELPSSLYAEGSVRAGRVDSDFASGDLQDPLGNAAEYEANSIYYGVHLGLGHVWELTQASSLDLYAKYFWTHTESDSVNMNGDKLEFESFNSHRLRAGARFAYDLPRQDGATITPYIGAAYEYEFDGKAGATAYGYALDAAELTGGTGMGEAGLSFKPVSNSGLMLDLGLQGYLGQRQGVSGGLQLKWEF